MPIYEYQCEACRKPFEKIVRTADRDGAIACPDCGSLQTSRAMSAINVGGGDLAKLAAPIAGCGRCGGPGPCGMG